MSRVPRGNAATDTHNGNTQACRQRAIVPFKSENNELAELLVEVRTETRAERDRLRAVDDTRVAAITQSHHVHGEFFDRMY